MLVLIGNMQSLRPEADLAHQKSMEFRGKAGKIHQTLVKTLQQINDLRQEIQKKEAEKLSEKQQQLKKEATLKAQEKMKRGEKLSLEEFKLLVSTEEDESEGEDEHR